MKNIRKPRKCEQMISLVLHNSSANVVMVNNWHVHTTAWTEHAPGLGTCCRVHTTQSASGLTSCQTLESCQECGTVTLMSVSISSILFHKYFPNLCKNVYISHRTVMFFATDSSAHTSLSALVSSSDQTQLPPWLAVIRKRASASFSLVANLAFNKKDAVTVPVMVKEFQEDEMECLPC